MTDLRENIMNVLRFFTNRLFILALVMLFGFGFLVVRLFDIQIVEGTYHVPSTNTSQRVIRDAAPRGEIFDINGRPLAINQQVFAVIMDPSLIFDVVAGSGDFDLNDAFLMFVQIMRDNDEEINIQSEFLLSDTLPRLFSSSEATQRRWKNDLGIDAEYNAEQTYAALLERFDIPLHLSRDDAHILLQLRVALQLERWNVGQVRLALDVDNDTVASLQEHGMQLPGLRIVPEWLRYYPEGRYMTNIIGFIRRISAEDLAANEEYGLTQADMFGTAGIERSMEHQLRGTRGETIIEIDPRTGRRIDVISDIPPIPGDDIFLTVDAVLQRQIYYIIEDHLVAVLLNRLRSQQTTFAREILESTLSGNNINSLLIMDAEQDDYPASFAVRSFVLANSDIDHETHNIATYRTALNDFIGENIINGRITLQQMIRVMAEQDIIDYASISSIVQNNPVGAIQAIIETRQLTPQMINIDPATGSAVITDVHTGAITAAVNYPTFNGNHYLPHSFNNDYIWQISNDPTNPQFARAFREAIAPGSTFKMITALAGLDSGVITPETRIFDNVTFRDAGRPYVNCWIAGRGGHGHVNVVDAIAVSCNYFFNRVAFNLGNRHTGQTVEGIHTLNYYMRAFGLGAPTGVEVLESPPQLASPEFRMMLDGTNWTDGNTSHVSIGQGYNQITATAMAKVMATIATGGTRLKMTLINQIRHADGSITTIEPVVEYTIDVSPEHMNAIHQGMLATSTRGTGVGSFSGFPIRVGVKSGTAEVDNSRLSHTSFGGFAPFDDPQIAAYVSMPHSDSPFLRNAAGLVIRSVLAEYFGLNHTVDITAQNNIR
ncbi:MAG: penicillin-binding transpeptidase domain-containing protein [Defluviitaleaceae bacterium]|nr:penicillin-binding transpeptidase domain-containing protein [Defluviitaleaceae bacterium]